MNSILPKTLLALGLFAVFFFTAYHFDLFSLKKEIPTPENASEKRFSIPTRDFDLDTELKPAFDMPEQTNILGLDSADFYKVMDGKVGSFD